MSETPSPLLLSFKELPKWFRQRTRNSVSIAPRSRMLVIALACMLAGYMLTASLSPESQYAPHLVASLDKHLEDGLLEGPVAYGHDRFSLMEAETTWTDPERHRAELDQDKTTPSRPPTIKGALYDLHSAVTDKLSSLRKSAGDARAQAQNITHEGVFTSSDQYNISVGANATAVSEAFTAPINTLGARTRVGKVTIIFGTASMYERAVRTHETHDRMHNYPLHVLRHGIMDDVWSKPAYMLSLLLRELCKPEAERLQWLLWVDADTILLNPFVPVETFLPPSPEFDDVHLLVTRDWNGLNNGVFPVRVNQWSVDFFSAIVSFRFFRPDVPLVFRDQSAMDEVLKDPKFSKNAVYAPQRWFNAYQGEHNETLAPFQARRGDFLVHFAGVGNRDERMAYWLDRVEQHMPDWEIEVQHTSYPVEAREFWSEQRTQRREAGRIIAEARSRATDAMQKTEEQLNEYQSRLQQGDIDAIRAKKLELVNKLEGDGTAEQFDELVQQLNMVKTPLEAQLVQTRKALLKQAHESLFAAEKTLLLLGTNDGGTDGTLPPASSGAAELDVKIDELRRVVLKADASPADLRAAIDEVRRLTAAVESVALPVRPAQAVPDEPSAVPAETLAATPAPAGPIEGAEPATAATEEAKPAELTQISLESAVPTEPSAEGGERPPEEKAVDTTQSD